MRTFRIFLFSAYAMLAACCFVFVAGILVPMLRTFGLVTGVTGLRIIDGTWLGPRSALADQRQGARLI